ncbi:MAG: hypothetical protein ACI8RZ_004897, partial [Myxococcota bacterium]
MTLELLVKMNHTMPSLVILAALSLPSLGHAADCTWYPDTDTDGYGAAADSIVDDCSNTPAGYTSQDGDCDDNDDLAWPGAPERLDLIDNDCSGAVDDLVSDDATASLTGDATDPLSRAFGVGDVDGDGTEDLLVTITDGFLVFSGADLSGTLSTADALAVVAGTVGGELGYAVASGDLDGDGLSDLFVGEPGESTVHVYLSGDDWLTTSSPSVSWSGSGRYGASLDLDAASGTGIIGAPASNAAYVVSGIPDAVTTIRTFSSIPDSSDIGHAVALGDIYTADGVLDYLLGAPLSSDPKPGEYNGTGMIFTFNPNGSCNWTWGSSYCQLIYGGRPSAGETGHAVITIGEVSGDSYGDWAGSAPFWEIGGRAVVGVGESIITNVHRSIVSQYITVDGTSSGEMLGESIAAGDLNGDGVSDLVIGAPGLAGGAAHVMLSDGTLCAGGYTPVDLDSHIEGSTSGDALGAWVTTGDFDGDGLADVAVVSTGGDGELTVYRSAYPDVADWSDPRCIIDTDGDGVSDEDDAFPDDASESSDTDSDGVGDNSDDCFGFPNVDTDLDGVCDSDDVCPTDELDTNDDNDSVCDVDDICVGVDNVDTDGDQICDDLDVCDGNDAAG